MRPSEQRRDARQRSRRRAGAARAPAARTQVTVVTATSTFRRGDTVRLRPAHGGDPYDRMLDGRTRDDRAHPHDVDDRLYFAVTVDGDPGQDLLRDTGRYLFFFEGEVEPA